MVSLTDQIKQAFSALGMANAGEVSGRYRMEAALHPGPASVAPTCPTPGRRLIALGVGATLPAPVLGYAASVCRRLQADLLFLTTDPLGLYELLAAHRTLLKGLVPEAEELSAVNRRAVLRVLERRSRVLFAITGTPDDPVRCLVQGKRTLFMAHSPVPVVMVSDPTVPLWAKQPYVTKLSC